ncbi:MAG: pseudouridine synthase [Candidatus Eisenbacteria bacterium]
MPARTRLNKFLRDCHLGSRRKCELLVEQGLVTINGEVVSEIGTLVDPMVDVVEVRNEEVAPVVERFYVAAYKPRGTVVTASDPQERETVFQAIGDLPEGSFTVGRLDMESEGLLLLTNDGKLSHRLSHPRFAVERVYEVEINGSIGKEVAGRLTDGVELDDGIAKAKCVEVLRQGGGTSALMITLTEGKKREIRRMMAACGHEVTFLKRTRFGTATIGDLKPGEWRHLTRDEVRGLRRIVEEAYLTKLKGAEAEENSHNH